MLAHEFVEKITSLVREEACSCAASAFGGDGRVDGWTNERLRFDN